MRAGRLIAALAVLVVSSFVLGNASTAMAASNSNIPGLEIPATPFTDSLSAYSDYDDVWSFPMEAGQYVEFWVSTPAPLVAEAAIFGPSAKNVFVDTPLDSSLNHSNIPIGQKYTAWYCYKPGTYYLDVAAVDSWGPYTIEAHSHSFEKDDNIPGVTLAATSTTGFVAGRLETHDVYALEVPAGEAKLVSLVTTPGLGASLRLFSPDATNVTTNAPMVTKDESATVRWLVIPSAEDTKTYYVDVQGRTGSGRYTLNTAAAVETTLSVVASTNTPVYGGAVTLTAGLSASRLGTPLSGQTILFERQSGSDWLYAGAGLTDQSGIATCSVSPTQGNKTVYRARFRQTDVLVEAQSGSVVVTPRAWVGNPIAPTSAYRSRAFTVIGYLKPIHKAGTYPVRVYRYRYVNGTWCSYGYTAFKVTDYSGYSKYYGSMSLPVAGKWRLRGYAPADANHSASWSSGYDYLTVK